MEIIVNIVRPNYIANVVLLDELNHRFFLVHIDLLINGNYLIQ